VCHHQCWLVISDDVCPSISAVSISAVSSTPAGSIDHGGDGATEPVRTTDSLSREYLVGSLAAGGVRHASVWDEKVSSRR
jgi:hypothetical protein